MFKRPGLSLFTIWFVMVLPSGSLPAVPGIPPEARTLSRIVLDVKAPLNRKLDELRKTYGIRETKAGGLRFTDKQNQVVLRIETNRTLNAERTQRVEEFLYTNKYQNLILHEKVITQGEDLVFHDFEKRLFQTGVEDYDLEGDHQTLKDATISMGEGTVFRVLTSRGEAGTVATKRHQVFVGESQQIEIMDTVDTENDYRAYVYRILEPRIFVRATGHSRMGYAQWLGMLRVAVRRAPGLLVPEVTYEKVGANDSSQPNGSEHFSRELYEKLVFPFIEDGPVRLIRQVVESNWGSWPASKSMQTIGTESRFLNELVVIRNEVNQAKANPLVLSLIEGKLNVIIKDIEEGALKISDFR